MHAGRPVFFYFLSKTLDLLVAPLTWALALSAVASWAIWRKRARLALRAQLAGLAILYLFSTGPITEPIIGALESGARTTVDPGVTYDVVVVLGGFLDVDAIRASGRPELTEAADRIVAGYDILRTGRARNAIVTSGPVDSPVAARMLVDWGIAADRVVVEDRSLNTRNNAIRSAEIIRGRGWSRVLLVTSAMHMPRAQGCFRAAGLEVDTLPVDRRYSLAPLAGLLSPRASSLDEGTEALREALGRLVYRLVGFVK
jgi:uncharacterized SAM-binding protein YcdF (DUF218 family)